MDGDLYRTFIFSYDIANDAQKYEVNEDDLKEALRKADKWKENPLRVWAE